MICEGPEYRERQFAHRNLSSPPTKCTCGVATPLVPPYVSTANGTSAPPFPFEMLRGAFILPLLAAAALECRGLHQVYLGLLPSYRMLDKYARLAPTATKIGEPLANQPRHSSPKYPYTNTASRLELSQTHAGGSPLRRGLPSTPRPTGEFIVAWVWRATGRNVVPLHLAGNDVGPRKPEAAKATRPTSIRRRVCRGGG